MSNETEAIVSAIERNRPSLKIDKGSMTDIIIREINRRTIANNKSPLLG